MWGGREIMMNKGDIIRDGENYFSVLCIVGSVVYIKQIDDVNATPVYELEDILKKYRKIEIMKK